MEVAWKESFVEQERRYRFCFTCEHCAHFDELSGECLHGFPTETHRLEHYRSEPPPETILFCKEFDLA
jgi:hypothetical protein